MTCQEYKEWIEEKWEEPIRSRKTGYKQECKAKKCKKWCLCCNKWACSLLTFWYWLVEWIIRIVAKWVVYVICRVIAATLTLLDAIWNGLWGFYCRVATEGSAKSPADIERLNDLNFRLTRTLRLQAIIVDRDEKTRNQITEAALIAMIAAADRILTERAHIQVRRKGTIKRTISKALYDTEGGSAGGVGEWFLNVGRLIGRDSPLHLTVYAVGRIGGAQGVHYPVYGSVFVTKDSQVTTLCHELGHALLNVTAMGHSGDIMNLMYETGNEAAVGWPIGTPTLERNQWCPMRRSRWLDFEWTCEICL